MAWVERITRPISARVNRVRELGNLSRVIHFSTRPLTIMGQGSGPGKKKDKSTGEGLGLLAPQLTHVVQQSQPRRLLQPQASSEENKPVAAVRQEAHSAAGMVLRAPSQGSVPAARQQEGEAPAQANEQRVTEPESEQEPEPQPVDFEEVADKVYHLMRRELIIEGERATRRGG